MCVHAVRPCLRGRRSASTGKSSSETCPSPTISDDTAIDTTAVQLNREAQIERAEQAAEERRVEMRAVEKAAADAARNKQFAAELMQTMQKKQEAARTQRIEERLFNVEYMKVRPPLQRRRSCSGPEQCLLPANTRLRLVPLYTLYELRARWIPRSKALTRPCTGLTGQSVAAPTYLQNESAPTLPMHALLRVVETRCVPYDCYVINP